MPPTPRRPLDAPLLHLLEQIGLPERVRGLPGSALPGQYRDARLPHALCAVLVRGFSVQPVVNPPHRPDLNALVERLHGTLEREYCQRVRPGSLEATRESLPLFQQHYNTERPHQGRSCGNRPPAIAHPQLPARPRLPTQVDPDRWLAAYHERGFARRVKANGSVLLDDREYYVGRQYAGRDVVAQLEAPTRQVWFLDSQRTVLKVKPLRGLVGAPMPLAAFVTWCEHEARTLWRRYFSARHPFKQAS